MNAGQFDTVLAIAVTPFDNKGEFDEIAYVRIIERMLAAGIQVIVVGGNTSEYYALSNEEWQRSVLLAAELARPQGAQILPGVGRDLRTACAQTEFAVGVGCGAVMVHQPVDPFISPAGWLRYHQVLHDSVPAVPLVGYVRDPRITGEDVLRLAQLERFAAVKLAIPDLNTAAGLVSALGPSRAVVCGLAELWAPRFATIGCTGFTSGLANVVPEVSLLLHRAMVEHEESLVRRLLGLVGPFEELRAAEHSAYNVAVVKEALAQMGLCGPDVRPPASRVPPQLRPSISDIASKLLYETPQLLARLGPDRAG